MLQTFPALPTKETSCSKDGRILSYSGLGQDLMGFIFCVQVSIAKADREAQLETFPS